MLWLDKKYINLISNRLQHFKWKTENLANFRCYFCGDSQKKQNKARGYFYEKTHGMLYFCHNCGHSSNLQNFLKEIDMDLFHQYKMEKFKDKAKKVVSEDKNEKVELQKTFDIDLPTIQELSEKHYARAYIQARCIPEEYYTQLYFTQNFKEFIDSIKPDHGRELYNEPRIIIPFYNTSNELISILGRGFEFDKKYLIVKFNDIEKRHFYGINKFKKDQKSYVVEGPFDSMFLPNCLAVNGVVLTEAEKLVERSLTTFIHDNQNRNLEVINAMEKTISHNNKIFIWPKSISEKDINELVIHKYSIEKILNLIEKNTFRGLAAKLELQLWKK